jgi:hypothetical protein
VEIFIWLLAIFITNSFLSIAVSYVAASKGRSAGGFFFLSFFFSFLVGILVVLALPKLESKLVVVSESGSFGVKESERLFKCPYCAEWVKAEAKICRFCNKEIAHDIARLSVKDLKAQKAEQLAYERQLKQTMESAQAKRVQRKERISSLFKGKNLKRLLLALVLILSLVTSGFLISSFLERQQLLESKSDWSTLVSQCDRWKTSSAPYNFGSAITETYTINSTNTELVFYVESEVQYSSWIGCLGKKIAVDPPAGRIGGLDYKDHMQEYLWHEWIMGHDFEVEPGLNVPFGNLNVLIEREDGLYKLTITQRN